MIPVITMLMETDMLQIYHSNDKFMTNSLNYDIKGILKSYVFICFRKIVLRKDQN